MIRSTSLPNCNAPRIALVTGAAGIIGPAITRELRSQGWLVAATDRSRGCFAMYEKAFGAPVDADAIIPADLGSQEACVELVREVESRFGGLSAVVNGAAFNVPLLFGSLTETEIRRLFAVNFMAPLFLTQAALPSLKKNRGGIVNLSSVLVDEPRAGGLLYACSKAALEKATEIISLELLEHGVQSNTIRIGRVPGYAFLREAIKDLPDNLARRMVRELVGRRLEEMEKNHGPTTAGRPEDIARTLAFLLSPAGRFINGQTLVLDGGFVPQANGKNAESPLPRLIAEWMQANAPLELCASPK